MILKSNFGRLKDGREVIKYSLRTDDIEVSILNYGGIITEILQGDRDGSKKNIVLGYNNIEDYEEKSPYFGSITGRVAGRISRGEFKIDGRRYKLPVNNGINTLHGGLRGLDKQIWDVKEVKEEVSGGIAEGVKLSYISKHLEEGFPGEVKFRVKYLLAGSELSIEYSGGTDRKTFINLTNHTYFNLSGGGEGILSHDLYIDSDRFVELDGDSIPTGTKKDVGETIFDRRRGGTLEEIEGSTDSDIEIVGGGFDHPFILNKLKDQEILLREEKSGRNIEIETSEPVVVVYTGNFLGEEGLLSCGVEARKYSGICLETQDYPDAPNQDMVKTRYTEPLKPYRSQTKYRFFTD